MDFFKLLLSIGLFLVFYFLPILITKIITYYKNKKQMKGE